jgi:hypothetical protein
MMKDLVGIYRVQILFCWTLSIVLHLSKNTVVFSFQNTTLFEAGFCLRHQVKPTQLGPIDRVSPYLRTMDNVQQHNISTYIPSSQTFGILSWPDRVLYRQ